MTIPLMRPIRTENEERLLEAAKAVLAMIDANDIIIDKRLRPAPTMDAAIAIRNLRLAVAQASGDEESK